MSEQELVRKWNDRKLIEETIKSMGIHSSPSSETIGRLSTLEANYKNMDEKIDHIIDKFDKLEEKIECAIENKADRKEVDELKLKIEDLNNWKLKILGGVSVIAVLFSIFKEQIINIFK